MFPFKVSTIRANESPQIETQVSQPQRIFLINALPVYDYCIFIVETV